MCGASGLTSCSAAIDSALLTTYNQLAAANGSTNVSSWTNDVASHNAGQTMPVYDDIQLVAVGIVGQPAIDWQNRPTFQQVVEFPGALSTDTPELPAGALPPVLVVAALSGALWLRRRRRERREGGDSNPRRDLTSLTRLAGGRFQPLSHLPTGNPQYR